MYLSYATFLLCTLSSFVALFILYLFVNSATEFVLDYTIDMYLKNKKYQKLSKTQTIKDGRDLGDHHESIIGCIHTSRDKKRMKLYLKPYKNAIYIYIFRFRWNIN